MQYVSTRDRTLYFSAAEAIAQGLSKEGGLFVPDVIPQLNKNALGKLREMTYSQRAVYIMSGFLDGFSTAELTDYTRRAYGPRGFDTPLVAPLRQLNDRTFFLELWHGPTCAFKDMALQILPYLLTASMRKNGSGHKVCVLVATSGDTGKAALEGFADVENTKIYVFYPENGVSNVQKLQMTSQSGSNVAVCAIKGNFDDAQTSVKKVFSDAQIREELYKNGWVLSSANSINWGRLLPQIVYYISAYCDVVNNGGANEGDKINFCVPTGNFGDILAGYYAKEMGLPINRLICASNSNDVLTDFIETGVYDRNRPFYTTISPSMDILISSNLERLLYLLSGGNDKQTSRYMEELGVTGRYEVSDEIMEGLRNAFAAGSCNDEETKGTIRDVFYNDGYLIDTHTAVAYNVLTKYREKTGDDSTPTVVVSTASPFKFCESVLDALGSPATTKGPELIETLERFTGVAAPVPLKALRGKTARFTDCVEPDDIVKKVRDFLL